jgi:diguanylate cyclase (GGDEF)-like protein
MNEQFGDARREELQLLSEIDRQGNVSLSPIMTEPRRDMLAFLVAEGFVADPAVTWHHRQSDTYFILPGESDLERTFNDARIRLLSRALGEQQVSLKLTHRGRVRLSELKQALRAGREREPFGILWDVRHWEQDLQIAILEAREGSPVALAYLDMNGLKQTNDTHGHDAGDLALRTYFQVIASVLGDRGQAYRMGGAADEVLVVLPNCHEQAAVQIVRIACTKLMSERLFPTDPDCLLSLAAGVITSTDPGASPPKLRSVADEEQKRAKQRSKGSAPRPSVIAVNGQDVMMFIEHGAKVE